MRFSVIIIASIDYSWAIPRCLTYVTPQDVKSIGADVLRHRLLVTYEAEAEEITAENLLQRIFDHLKVP